MAVGDTTVLRARGAWLRGNAVIVSRPAAVEAHPPAAKKAALTQTRQRPAAHPRQNLIEATHLFGHRRAIRPGTIIASSSSRATPP
jgi:hypothetical protein